MINTRPFTRLVVVLAPALAMLALLVAPAMAKMPGYHLDVATEGSSATFTLVVDGINDSVPADQRCCGPNLDGLLEVFPADAVGPDLRPLPGEIGRPVNLREMSAGVYSGTVLLGDGEWTVVPFPTTDVSSVPYDFNDTYPAVTFETGTDSSRNVGLLIAAAILIVVVVSLTPRLTSSRS